eukprot:CAMPEP_0174312036 /NCGR_PEP_ID=MMETSP0810-20121108/4053_1 /TAXON_ID=73025 ORGANISM="Eutreptiella gymnastica-like, Strain CCMP1594" /NCGR_SAMPLE_ID=MMETSP0810 /ASSEMBLY_ACC=CAM_ASM_000659 /LENGTH=88 /DNA_ID=CAMNT_0015420357 /DNA_START=1413 /DNA_END=1675 /DNA_ORIENTATION=+
MMLIGNVASLETNQSLLFVLSDTTQHIETDKTRTQGEAAEFSESAATDHASISSPTTDLGLSKTLTPPWVGCRFLQASHFLQSLEHSP